MKFKVGDKVRYVGTRGWDDWKPYVPNYKQLTPVVIAVDHLSRPLKVGFPYHTELVWTVAEEYGDRFIKTEGGLYVNKRRSNANITSTSPNKSDGG